MTLCFHFLGSGENSGRSVTSVRLGQEFDVDVDAIAATMHQGQSKGTWTFEFSSVQTIENLFKIRNMTYTYSNLQFFPEPFCFY